MNTSTVTITPMITPTTITMATTMAKDTTTTIPMITADTPRPMTTLTRATTPTTTPTSNFLRERSAGEIQRAQPERRS